MGIRKFWIGVSEEDANRPSDYEHFIVFDDESLEEAQMLVAEWMAESYLNEDEEGL